MASMGKERRLERLNADYTGYAVLSDRGYNVAMGATVLYGIIINIILCALVGDVTRFVSPIGFIAFYFISAIAGSIIAHKSDKPAISFLGYNMIVVPMGLMLSVLISYYGGLGSRVVLEAFYFTALITAIMVVAASVFPQVFAKIGGFLAVSLIGILIASVVGMIFGWTTGGFSYFVAVIFSLYIGYDFYRSQQFVKTLDNAIDCAIDIYLDMANLFIRILEIVGRRD